MEKQKRRGRDEAQCLRDNLARFIVKQRKLLGMTQEELAHRVGISQSLMARIEKGQSPSDAVPLTSLASALNISEPMIRFVLIGYECMGELAGSDIMPLVRSIAACGLEELSPEDLLTLLKVEAVMRASHYSLEAGMVQYMLTTARKDER